MSRVRTLRLIGVPAVGPEDVLFSPDGSRLFTGTADGSVWSLTPDGSQISRIASTGGRPLGLEWLPDGRLLVCDSPAGLLAVDVDTGSIEELVTEIDGVPMRFTNNAAVAGDGTVFFSDSSRRYTVAEWKSDLIAHTRSGRLLRRSPDGSVTTLLEGLGMANGVALVAGEQQIWVAETALARIRRLAPDGRELAAITGLPAYPDNLAVGSDDLVWVALASPLDPLLGFLQGRGARLRPAVLGLPDALKPKEKRTARVLAYDPSGRLVHDLSGDSAQWHMATGARERGGEVWMGSIMESAIAVMSVDGGRA